MKKICIILFYFFLLGVTCSYAQQHLPYPIIFVHGLNSDNSTWDNLKALLKSNQYNWTYGGNMDFNLNYDGDNSTSILDQDYHDFFNDPLGDLSLLRLNPCDFYTVNFNVDRNESFGTGSNLSNQAAIAKQGRAISDAIKHVLAITGRDKVILVGHSMGGLAAREYLQNPNLWFEQNLNPHVAKLCTVGTPHGGSNVGDLTGITGDLIGNYYSNLDLKSEAVRDLRGNYTYKGNLTRGLYLFGGNELETKTIVAILNGLSLLTTYGALGILPFYNYDVNCNGSASENITGLNSKILPDIPISCIFGTNYIANLKGINVKLDGDGVVGLQSGNLNNLFPNLNADTFQVNNIFHTDLTNQFFWIMKGMDEPGNFKSAYNVELGKTYDGLISFQPANSSTSSDIDDYAVNVQSAGKLTINVSNIKIPVFTVSVYDATYKLIENSMVNSNGAYSMNVQTHVNAAGKYYVILAGAPTGSSWQYPYHFILNFSPDTPVTSSCYTSLSSSSGNISSLNYNNNSDCSWLINPSSASAITLHFNSFNTEANNDIVNIYDGNDNTYPLLGSYSGNTIPPYIVSSGSTMFVEFKTNSSVTSSGWTASYTSSSTNIVVRTPANIKTYRFWYDADITNGAIVNLTSTTGDKIDDLIQTKNTLNTGFHTLSFMVQQSDKEWSVPVTNNFYYATSGAAATYEYWFDSNYVNKQIVQIADTNNLVLTNQMLNMTSMANGFHQFNIRYKPNGGSWSVVQSSNFFKRGNDINDLMDVKKIQYWFDTSFSKRKEIITTGQNGIINSKIDCSTLSIGKHLINYQTMDNGNIWSSILIDSFTVTCTPPATPAVTSKNAITFCQGSTDTLQSNAASGNQWYLNGVAIPNATNNSFVTNANGIYSAVVTVNGCISDTSNRVTITVNPIPTSPTITSRNATTFCQGVSDTLISSANSGNQWYLNGAPITGSTNTNYIASATGNYTVISTVNNCSSNASSATSVTVTSLPTTPTITSKNGTTFCLGGVDTLISSANTGNQWYLNGAAITGAINASFYATSAGNYSLTTNNGTCTSLQSSATLISVNSLPSQPTISNSRPLTFCNGDSTILSSNANNGNQWYLNGSAISNATAVNYIVKASGNYSVVTTNSNGCSATSTAVTITNNPIPTTPTIVSKGSTTLCQGGIDTLISNAASGNQWFMNGTAISGATSLNYIANGGGNYTVAVTANNCTSAVSNTLVIVVNPIPSTPSVTSKNALSFCQGGADSLQSDALTGNQWLLNGIAIRTATGTNYVATTTGNYSVTTTINGCTSPASSAISIVVNALPAKPSITRDVNNNLVSSSATGNQWFTNSTAISGGTNQNYKPLIDGNYIVQVTQNGCSSPNSDPYYYLVTAINNLSVGESVTVYPNPVSDFFRIDYKLINYDKVNAELFNMSGAKLLDKSINSGYIISLTNLANGNYTLRLVDSKTHKLFYSGLIIKIK